MENRAQFLKGVARTLVLGLLRERPMYGYEIATALAARSEGVFALGQGTLYPLLYSLQSKGLIRVSREEEAPGAGRRRCYYMLTPAGHAELEANLLTWGQIARGMKLVLGGKGGWGGRTMRDAIEQYLDQVMAHAGLARRDQARVRAELKDHLAELAAEARKHLSTQEEITAMLESEFGKPEEVGKGISKAKGRFRTFLKKLQRGLAMAAAACLVLVCAIRWSIAEPFYVPGKGAEPSIPQGSRILVYKLASVFRPGDVVAFRNLDGQTLLGIVKTDQGGVLTVSRNGEVDREVPHARLIGRVVANTR